MTTADEIEAMLDAVAANQVRCPECGRSDDLYLIWPDWNSCMAGAPVAGGLVTGDTENENVILPDGLLATLPTIVMCGNHTDKNVADGPPFHFWTLDPPVSVDYDPYTLDSLKGWHEK